MREDHRSHTVFDVQIVHCITPNVHALDLHCDTEVAGMRHRSHGQTVMISDPNALEETARTGCRSQIDALNVLSRRASTYVAILFPT